MKNISFSLTTAQFLNRSKIVTRRVGWINTRAGDVLQAVKKAQGLRRGEKVEPLGCIKVKAIRFEQLRRLLDDPLYGKMEVILEGFSDMTPAQFVDFFCKSHKGITPESVITRIEYEYL